MLFTQRQRLIQWSWRLLATALALGLMLGFAGPFGSYPAYSTATRYGFWLGLTAAGVLAAAAADFMLPVTRMRSGAIRIGAVALISAVPMTFVVAWTFSLVDPGRVIAPLQLPTLFACVAAVQGLIVYATAVSSKPADQDETIDPAPKTAAPGQTELPVEFPSALLNRLPPEIGRDIVALETEDHYLRVHTTGGSALILMRMADAVAMLDPRLGSQVHRRWWVAGSKVAAIRSEGSKLVVRLIDERVVPVGATFAAAARARFGRLREPNSTAAT